MRRLLAAAVIGASLIAVTPAEAFWGTEKQKNYSWTSEDKWTNKPTRHGVSLHSGSAHGRGQKADLICDLTTGSLRIELPARYDDRSNRQVKIAFNNADPIIQSWALQSNNKARRVDSVFLGSMLNSDVLKIAWDNNFIQIDLKRYKVSIEDVSNSCF